MRAGFDERSGGGAKGEGMAMNEYCFVVCLFVFNEGLEHLWILVPEDVLGAFESSLDTGVTLYRPQDTLRIIWQSSCL